MAERLLFFGDETKIREAWSDMLRLQGFDVLHMRNTLDVETALAHPSLSVLVCTGKEDTLLEACQKLADRFPHVAVLYVLDQTDKNLNLCEHRICVKPAVSPSLLIESLRNLLQFARLHRRIHQLSQLASGSSAVEKMFSKLDVHHILDRVLSYFGTRMEIDNLHWVRWSTLPHMLQAEKNILALEMDVVEARSPRVMSLNSVEVSDLIHVLAGSLGISELEEKAKAVVWTRAFEGRSLLFVVVKALGEEAPLGLLLFEGRDAEDLSNRASQIVETLGLMTRYIEFGLTHWDSKALAMTDDLTELYNQRYLPTVLDNEINRAQRRRTEFTVLFMDLDYFKSVNDTKGHWIGSKLLVEVSQLLKRCVRSCDFAFRYGGDEFVVILPDTHIQGGQIVAERIRQSIETNVFTIEGHEMRLTVSVGLAGYPHHALTREEIIQLADQAMYYGKRKSRNVVYVAS